MESNDPIFQKQNKARPNFLTMQKAWPFLALITSLRENLLTRKETLPSRSLEKRIPAGFPRIACEPERTR